MEARQGVAWRAVMTRGSCARDSREEGLGRGAGDSHEEGLGRGDVLWSASLVGVWQPRGVA